MIEVDNVSYSVEDQKLIKNIDFNVKEGECIVLCGESGCGKTTVTKTINGLIPHFYENGNMKGEVAVDKSIVGKTKMYELAKIIGSVFQNPKSQFFHTESEAELAFGLENQGIEPEIISNRVEKVSEELHIQELLGRNIFKLSGGQKQMIAFASVYAANPKVYVLDEPSSNLDAVSIQNIKEIIKYLKSKEKTIVIAEHRLNYLNDVADRYIYISNGEIKTVYSKEEFLLLSDEARIKMGLRTNCSVKILVPENDRNTGDIMVKGVRIPYVEREINMCASAGDVLGIIGENGAGKSTLCRIICGLVKQISGEVCYNGKKSNRKERNKLCAFVMQDVNHQLFADSVKEECMLAKPDVNEAELNKVLEEFDLMKYKEMHPMVLSGGQKQRLAVCQSVLSGKRVLIFDEPTSGLDYRHMMEISHVIKKLSESGYIILIVTHDIEFLNETCSAYVEIK